MRLVLLRNLMKKSSLLPAVLSAAVLLAASFGCRRTSAPGALSMQPVAQPSREVERSLSPSRIEVVGSARFSNQVFQALLLLETKAPEAYSIITNYVGRIQQGTHSGMWAYKTPPTYEMADPTAFYSLTWCA